MTPRVEVSLLICTRNRAQALERCLEAVAASDPAAHGAELVLVDNGSTDSTPAVIQACRRRARFAVQALSAPAPGKSRALNSGIRAARGAIVAFTDDDCYLAKDYFAALRATFARRDLGYCGGRTLLFDPSDANYACTEQEAFELIPPRSFIPAGKIQGANMAFSRQLIDTVGQFDTRFGPGTRFRCEDVDYLARASTAGFTGAHVPELVVYHHHGRKFGREIDELSKQNDFGRGAYYAKQILRGSLGCLPNWARMTYRSRSWPVPHRLSYELLGAVAYLRASLGGADDF